VNRNDTPLVDLGLIADVALAFAFRAETSGRELQIEDQVSTGFPIDNPVSKLLT